jgi:hypothetical protein
MLESSGPVRRTTIAENYFGDVSGNTKLLRLAQSSGARAAELAQLAIHCPLRRFLDTL